MKRIFFDVETQKSSSEVGGWYPERMKLALAVTYDDEFGFRTWHENKVAELANELLRFDKVIGFNLLGFDYKVLEGYIPQFSLRLRAKTVDMLELIYKQLGFRIKLDDLASFTLDKQKSGDGLQAIQWWKEGRIDLIEQYCRQDVAITKELYEFGKANGVIYYSSRYRKTALNCPW